ncbi:MAG: hypothetical protein Fur003_1430 [Candidatus Dojkabacteria bacterium]
MGFTPESLEDYVYGKESDGAELIVVCALWDGYSSFDPRTPISYQRFGHPSSSKSNRADGLHFVDLFMAAYHNGFIIVDHTYLTEE